MKKSLLIALIFLGIGVSVSNAQNEEFKALFIYNVTSFVEWPSIGDKFTICVPDDPPAIQKFNENHGNKKIEGKEIEINKNIDLKNIPECQILYLPKNKNDQFKNVLSRIDGKPILLFTDGEGFAQKGSCLNFAVKNGKLTLQINRGNIEAQGLKVNHQLLELGQKID